MNEIKLTGVGKQFQSGHEIVHILHDVNFDVSGGDSVAITGESGSGKSTLLNLIAGLDEPTAGDITVFGTRISGSSEESLTDYRSHTIGLVFQFHYLLRDFSAEENVMMPAFMAGVPRTAATDRARALLERVGLSDRRDHDPIQLSGGERQRVAIARSLVNGPRVLLADEPTGNLDERNSRVVEDILFDIVADEGVTLLLVTHDLDLARRCTRQLALESGEVKAI
ncbi:MAG: ABC transporter ATP-binding protein [Spirochaetales bacterium]